MILFIFEGKKREPALFKTLEYLYFPKENQKIIYSYGNNIYSLYKEINNSNFTQDIVSVLREKTSKLKDNPFNLIEKTSDISEIYLFFDYDGQNKNQPLEELNKQINEMLDFFCDETENGKLYISYPMIESIRYTKELPDENYNSYKVKIADCGNFKQTADEFSFYKSLDFITAKIGTENNLDLTEEYNEKIKNNWELLRLQNVKKCFFLVDKEYSQKKKIIEQKTVFSSQLTKFIMAENTVSILNAFPIFLYDYF